MEAEALSQVVDPDHAPGRGIHPRTHHNLPNMQREILAPTRVIILRDLELYVVCCVEVFLPR